VASLHIRNVPKAQVAKRAVLGDGFALQQRAEIIEWISVG
jgi:hypothetical protein